MFNSFVKWFTGVSNRLENNRHDLYNLKGGYLDLQSTRRTKLPENPGRRVAFIPAVTEMRDDFENSDGQEDETLHT